MNRPVAVSATAALALVLATPGLALAGDAGRPESRPGGGPAHHDAGRPAEQPDQRPAGKEKADQPPGQESRQTPPGKAGNPSGRSRPDAKEEPGKRPAGRQGGGGGAEKDAGKGKGAPRPAAPPAAPAPAPLPPEDPPGNNGTIKISRLPVTDGRGNQPHVGCEFALIGYGFDAGQTADITFTDHAPTGSGEVLLSQSGVAISDDAAGGGQDRDTVLTFSAAQLGLSGPAPHRQGWHVKVSVDVLQAPGGAKQKVFWIDCPAGPSDLEREQLESGEVAGSGGTGSTAGGGGAAESTSVLSSAVVAGSGESRAARSSSTRTSPAEAAASATQARPSALPFTGAGGLVLLAGLAVLALAAGAALVRLGQHRRAQAR